MDWIFDLLITYTHHSGTTRKFTALPLISTLYISPQHPLRLLQPAVFTSRSLATTSNSGDSSALRAHAVPSPTLLQNCLPAISPGTPNPILCCNCQLSRCHLFSIILPTATSGDSLNYLRPPILNSQLAWNPSNITSRPSRKHRFHPYSPTIPRLLLAYSSPREHVYWAVA
jgi:hypothetical protein